MFAHFGIKDFIDVLLVAALLYYLFRLVKISGLRPLFVGILVFMVIWILVSRVFNMVLLGSILDQFVSVGLFLLVILFQDEIRRFLMSLGSKRGWNFITKLIFPTESDKKDNSHLTAVVLACMNMSRTNTGALIAVQAKYLKKRKERVDGDNKPFYANTTTIVLFLAVLIVLFYILFLR